MIDNIAFASKHFFGQGRDCGAGEVRGRVGQAKVQGDCPHSANTGTGCLKILYFSQFLKNQENHNDIEHELRGAIGAH